MSLEEAKSHKELFLSSSSGSQELLERMVQELNFVVSNIKRIEGGLNNRIFLLSDDAGARYVAKLYNQDARNRLEREYKACLFLTSNGFTVPTPYIKSDEHNYGVYSFEEGKRVFDRDIQKRDVDFLVDFIVRLEQFTADNLSEPFERGIASLHTTKEFLEDNHSRIEKLNTALSQGSVHPIAEQFLKESDVVKEISMLTEQRMAAWNYPWWKMGKDELRLSPVDFGLHNVLFREDKSPCFLDLEYFGWDDPFNTITNHLTQDQSTGMPSELYDYTIQSYANAMQLSEYKRERLQLVIDLFHIKWLAIYLTSLTPELIAKRAFALGEQFNVENHLTIQIAKIKARLERIHTGM